MKLNVKFVRAVDAASGLAVVAGPVMARQSQIQDGVKPDGPMGMTGDQEAMAGMTGDN